MPVYAKNGLLEVVCGSMFSGKSEELLRRMRRAMHARQRVQLFKHSLDDRKSLTHVHTHTGDKMHATPVTNARLLLELLDPEAQLIGIDEVQFFAKDIILVVDELVRGGKHVIVAGLDLDFRGLPFGPVPYLMALADDVTKLKAVCSKTGEDAHFSQRIINGLPARYNDPVVMIGAKDCYEARSRASYEIDHIPLATYVDTLPL